MPSSTVPSENILTPTSESLLLWYFRKNYLLTICLFYLGKYDCLLLNNLLYSLSPILFKNTNNAYFRKILHLFLPLLFSKHTNAFIYGDFGINNPTCHLFYGGYIQPYSRKKYLLHRLSLSYSKNITVFFYSNAQKNYLLHRLCPTSFRQEKYY
jgi:hypothetical protein